MTLDQFFLRAGLLLDTAVSEEGQSPFKSFTSCFFYEWGWAKYDGSEWSFDTWEPTTT